MRQNNPPEKSAMATCWIHPQLKPTEFTRRKDPLFNSRLACQRSPLPCSKSPGKTRPGPLTHLERVLLLSFPFSLMVTYPYMTRHMHILHRADWYESIIILLQEKELFARKGWGASLLPAPLKGVFCTIVLLQEVSRLAILTRIETHKHIIFRYTLTNIYQHRNDITAPQIMYTVSSYFYFCSLHWIHMKL